MCSALSTALHHNKPPASQTSVATCQAEVSGLRAATTNPRTKGTGTYTGILPSQSLPAFLVIVIRKTLPHDVHHMPMAQAFNNAQGSH